MMFNVVKEAYVIRDFIETRDWTAIRSAIDAWPEADIADLLKHLPAEQRFVVFRLLPKSKSAGAFALLDAREQNELLESLNRDETRDLLAEMSPDDRTHLFEELPGIAVQKLLHLLDPADLAETQGLLGYAEDSVGRLMTPDFVAIRPDWTIAQAYDHIREKGSDSETVDVLYITDEQWRLLDALAIRKFILALPNQQVRDLMDDTYVALSVDDDQVEAVRQMERYDLSVLPVVDSDGVLVGIVTFDDVMDVAEAEVTEDFQLASAVEPLRMNYLDATRRQIYKRRTPWLVVLVFVNIFSGAAIAQFEDTIAAAVALVFFLPLLIDSGGNAGSQAATLMIRSMATGDIRMSDWSRLFLREIGIAAALGVTMGVAVSWLGFYRGGTDVGLAVTSTMVMVVVVGSVIGLTLPFVFN